MHAPIISFCMVTIDIFHSQALPSALAFNNAAASSQLLCTPIPNLPPHRHPPAMQGAPPSSVTALLDALLSLIQDHSAELPTASLALVLGALARSSHRPAHAVVASLRAQLEGDAGLERADAAGPREVGGWVGRCVHGLATWCLQWTLCCCKMGGDERADAAGPRKVGGWVGALTAWRFDVCDGRGRCVAMEEAWRGQTQQAPERWVDQYVLMRCGCDARRLGLIFPLLLCALQAAKHCCMMGSVANRSCSFRRLPTVLNK